MKLPGEALLEFSIESPASGVGTPLSGTPARLSDSPGCLVVQTATFLPRGLAGLAYWYPIKPFHNAVFNGMLSGIRGSAEQAASMPIEGAAAG